MIDDIVFDSFEMLLDLDDESGGTVENISFGNDLYSNLPVGADSGEVIWVG